MDNWLNLGVDGGCCWPRQEEKIAFGGHELLLKPATIKTEQSIHVNLAKERISSIDAMTLVNRFLSILSWCDCGNKGMNILYGFGVSGSAVPVAISIRTRIVGSSIAFPFYRDIEKKPKACLALALYREGLNIDSVPLSFLSFFKIINIFYNDKAIIKGLENLLPYIQDDRAQKRLQELKKTVNDIPTYLYKCRCATAHAFTNPTTDPDNVTESRDLSQDLWIIRSVADYLIEKKLSVSRSILKK